MLPHQHELPVIRQGIRIGGRQKPGTVIVSSGTHGLATEGGYIKRDITISGPPREADGFGRQRFVQVNKGVAGVFRIADVEHTSLQGQIAPAGHTVIGFQRGHCTLFLLDTFPFVHIGVEIADLTVQASAPQAPAETCPDHQIDPFFATNNLQIITGGVEAIPAGQAGFIPVVTKAPYRISPRGKPQAARDHDGIGSGAFLVVEVKHGIHVEQVIGIPQGGHPPVDALSAGPHLPASLLPVKVQAVEGGVAQHIVLAQPVPGQVEIPRVSAHKIFKTGNVQTVSPHQTVAHTCVE